ncbi:MAG: zinc ribbon domain-containing protein [Selenomonadaceae bacterium]|nr:zinc ribbon domain-containing protein [Selenomonadaceae bacterium]
MAKKNIFEMLGLEFDPPDNLKKIRAAYENWKKRLTAEQNTTVDSTRLAEIKSELEMDNYISQVIENPKLRQVEAESLKQNRIEQLRLYIDIQRGDTSGTLQVNQSQIKKIKEKLKLSPATIAATYKEQGFDVKPARTDKSIVDTLNNFFIADSVLAELDKYFAEFRKVPDRQNYAWSSEVHNFYELAYYLEHKIEPSAEFYKRRDTDELCEIFKKEAKKISSPIPAWQSLKALLNLAETQIFNTDDNRWKYDHSLQIETLANFFAKIKAAPDMFKHDKNFADNCINRIRGTFPNFLNYERSAALYNKAAGILNDPYESVDNAVENFYCVTCGNCGAFENFRTHEEAERAACKICGKNFFVECPKCGKKVPATVEHCPSCDFSFHELRRYNYYVSYMNSLLDLINRGAKSESEDVKPLMTEVIKVLARTKLIKPESIDLRKIEWRINGIATDIKRRELLRWAESKLPALTVHPDKVVGDCMEILSKLPDYRPARDRLKLVKPKRPLKLTAIISENIPQPVNSSALMGKISVNAKSTSMTAATSNLICKLTWQPANDLGVKYTVIRKLEGIPQSPRDGELVAENIEKFELTDTNIKSGLLYGYAIFAVRLGTLSDPTTCSTVFYGDIEENKLVAKTEDGQCKFSWKLPAENCLGVRILRTDNAGNSVVVADCVQSPFVDKAVKNLKQYSYRLQCVYYSAKERFENQKKFLAETDGTKVWRANQVLKYSQGLTVELTPEFPPRAVENLTYNLKSGKIKFSWQNTGEFEIWFKQVKPQDVGKGENLSNSNDSKNYRSIDLIDEVLGSDVILKRVKSSDESCEFSVQGEVVNVAVVSATKNFFLVNEIISAANIEPCEIDERRTTVDSSGLKLTLKKLPPNAYMIHYKVSTDESEETFATIDDAKSRHMNRIYATKYAQDTFITQAHMPEEKLFITVIGEYKLSDGSTVYSPPSTMTLDNRPKVEISYRLEWGTSGLFNKTSHAKNCKLIIESSADATPKLFLACRKDGRLNISLADKSTVVLYAVPEFKNGLPNKRLELSLPDEIWREVDEGFSVKLLAKDSKRFELSPSKPDSLTVPKK